MAGSTAHAMMGMEGRGTPPFHLLALLVVAWLDVLTAKPAHVVTFTVKSTGDGERRGRPVVFATLRLPGLD
jgi:hypothetical protein